MGIEYKVGNKIVELVQGSITRYRADALVCPANPDLEAVIFPWSIQGAFARDGGMEIFHEACRIAERAGGIGLDTPIPTKVPPCSAHITTAGRLAAKKVIHAVAVGYDIEERRAYCDGEIICRTSVNVLRLASEHEFDSIGFPALGTGLYSVPLEDSINAMMKAFVEHLKTESPITRIGLALYDAESYEEGKRCMDDIFSKETAPVSRIDRRGGGNGSCRRTLLAYAQIKNKEEPVLV